MVKKLPVRIKQMIVNCSSEWLAVFHEQHPMLLQLALYSFLLEILRDFCFFKSYYYGRDCQTFSLEMAPQCST